MSISTIGSGIRPKWYCKLCDIRFGTERAQVKHMQQTHHQSQNLKCPGCGEGPFERVSGWMSHVESRECKVISTATLETIRASKLDFARRLEEITKEPIKHNYSEFVSPGRDAMASGIWDIIEEVEDFSLDKDDFPGLPGTKPLGEPTAPVERGANRQSDQAQSSSRERLQTPSVTSTTPTERPHEPAGRTDASVRGWVLGNCDASTAPSESSSKQTVETKALSGELVHAATAASATPSERLDKQPEQTGTSLRDWVMAASRTSTEPTSLSIKKNDQPGTSTRDWVLAGNTMDAAPSVKKSDQPGTSLRDWVLAASATPSVASADPTVLAERSQSKTNEAIAPTNVWGRPGGAPSTVMSGSAKGNIGQASAPTDPWAPSTGAPTVMSGSTKSKKVVGHQFEGTGQHNPRLPGFYVERYWVQAFEKYCCPKAFCTKEFKTGRALVAHLLSTAHNDRTWVCPSCLKGYKSLTAITMHAETPGNCAIRENPEFDAYLDQLTAGLVAMDADRREDGSIVYKMAEKAKETIKAAKGQSVSDSV